MSRDELVELTPEVSERQAILVGDLSEKVDRSLSGGVYANSNGDVVVTRTRSDRSPLPEGADSAGYQNRVVRFSIEELESIELGKLAASFEEADSPAPLILGLSVNTQLNKVIVYVNESTPPVKMTEIRRSLAKDYQGMLAVSPEPVSSTTATRRYWSTLPFYGGERIIAKPTNAICTSGFKASYSSGVYMATAGHCANDPSVATYSDGRFKFATSFVGGAASESGCSGICANGYSLGSIRYIASKVYASKSQAQQNPSIDMALIYSGSYADETWLAGSASSHIDNSSYPGASINFTGLSACHSGATTLGRCSWKVIDHRYQMFCLGWSGTVCVGGWANYRVWSATNTRGLYVCGGDSGGTVYAHHSSGGASVYGVVTGSVDVGNIDPGQCADDAFFTTWGDASSGIFPGIRPSLS